MKTIDEIERVHGELITIRRDIHAHPEIAFQETRTSRLVADKLREWGLEVHTGLGQTGVVGVLHGTKGSAQKSGGKKSLGLRADMDALPMPEYNRFAHASTISGRMHGCGHDGHTTMLLGAARYLSAHRELFDGTVNFIFQPAEEGGNAGARAMIEDGLFDKFPCDAIFGLHNMPGLPTNTFCFRAGPFMASSNRWDIVIRGVGGHAAMPNRGVDPIVMSAEVVQALQTIISRRRDPLDPAVLSITQIHAGDAYNVIPNEVVLRGTVRTFTTETLDQIENDMRGIVTTLPQVYGGSGELQFTRLYPPVVNHARETAFAAKVARDAFGAERVDENTVQLMVAEDFAFYLQKVPGAYLFLGNGDGDHREASYHGMGPCQLHSSSYDFNDALLPVGATYWVKMVEVFFEN